MTLKTCLNLSLLTLSVVASAGIAEPPATRPADLELKDVVGVVRRPLDVGTSKVGVILFISADCPISNGYAPEIARICSKYEPLGVTFFLVHADPDLTDAAAAKHAREFGFSCPVIVDRKHELVHRLGATVTPQVFVLDPSGKTAYSGRIDDLYISIGKRRFETTTHDLRLALDAVLSGKPVPTPRTTPIGCSISE